MDRHGTRWLALLASFSIYFVPLIGPHTLFVLGTTIAVGLVQVGDEKEAAWIATEVAFALVLQALAFALFAWVLSGRAWRWIAVLPAAAAAVWVTNVAFLVVMPTYFLLEPDTAPELATWPAACTVEDASVLHVPSGATLALARAGEAWIQREPEGTYAVLRMPECRFAATRHRRSGTVSVDFVAPRGRALYRVREQASNTENHWFDSGDGAPPAALHKPSDKWWNPILASDASAIAWIESEPGGRGRRPVYRVAIRDLDRGTEKRFAVPESLFSGVRILDFQGERVERSRAVSRDAAPGQPNRSQVLVAGGDNLVAAFDLQGRLVWGPVRTGEVRAGAGTLRRVGDGWVAWDGYRDRERYRLQWSLAGGNGRHEVLKGRSITDVAVDPGGRFIAVSVSKVLNVGEADDAVYVLRVTDGREVQRRYLGRFNRTPVAFLGSGYLALHRHRTEGGRIRATVEVLAVPQ